jgi:hypothetical protein
VSTDNEVMSTETDTTASVPCGARLFPGVDLTLWTALIIGTLLAILAVTGAAAALF